MTEAEKEEWKTLTLKNNYIFTKMLEDHSICGRVIEAATGIPVGKLQYITTERTIDIDMMNKSVRLDVYTRDESNVYNVEMQATNLGELVRRSRMYSSIITVESLFKGVDYEEVPDSYVLFFCDFDLFLRGEPVYTFRYACEEIPELKLEDGTYMVFLNGKARGFQGNERLLAIFKYMNGEVTEDELIQDMEERMKIIKANPDWRRECMTLIKHEQLVHRQGVQKGIEIGLERGLEQGLEQGFEKAQIEMAYKMFGTMTDEVIASFTELPLEQVSLLRKESNLTN